MSQEVTVGSRVRRRQRESQQGGRHGAVALLPPAFRGLRARVRWDRLGGRTYTTTVAISDLELLPDQEEPT